MKKNVYEVVTQLPKGVNPEEVCKALDASSFKIRAGGMVKSAMLAVFRFGIFLVVVFRFWNKSPLKSI